MPSFPSDGVGHRLTPALSDLTPIPSDNAMEVDVGAEEPTGPSRPRRATRRKANAVVVNSSESEAGELREDDNAHEGGGEAKDAVGKKAKGGKGGAASKKRKTGATSSVDVSTTSDDLGKKDKKAGGGRKAAVGRREVDDQAGRVGLRATRPPLGGASTLPKSLRG